MQPPDRRLKHLLDIEQVTAQLEHFSKGRTVEDLLGDRALQLIFEREFEILGEAMQRLLREDPNVELTVTNARRIVGLRDILAHGYDVIDHRILWEALVLHLPRLKAEIDSLFRGIKE